MNKNYSRLTDEDDDINAFILNEHKAKEEMKKNPLHKPLLELTSDNSEKHKSKC